MNLFPKEAPQIRSDFKYIGPDVHQEAIALAVLNDSGKLVRETAPKAAAFCSSCTVCGASCM